MKTTRRMKPNLNLRKNPKLKPRKNLNLWMNPKLNLRKNLRQSLNPRQKLRLSQSQSLNSEIQKDDGISKLGEIAVKLKDDGTSYIEIPKEYLSSVSRVTYVMGSYSEEDKKEGTPAFIMIIGEGGQLTADWDKGIFSDKFGGAWPMLGDSMLSLEVTNVTDRYITYDSHVKVNKKDASMNIVYDIKSNTYKIIGYTPIDESGIAQRSVRFKKGDEIYGFFN